MARNQFVACTFVLACLLQQFQSLTAAEPATSISLFNGKNLEGWYADVPDADNNPDIKPSFLVRDGKLVSMGVPRGHLITKKSYKDYRLEVEYRFAGKPGNCGVLVHTDGKRPRALYKMFPASLEVQMQHKAAGDFWCIHEDIKVPNMAERRKGPKENWGGKKGQSRHIHNLTDDSEKPLGDWNTMIIECLGDKIRVWVNGDLVNDGFECTAKEGQISLQAEGAEVEFRKLELTPIEKLTAAKDLAQAVIQKDQPGAKKIKVFVLAGQSNMQGHGRIAMGKDGDLDYAAKQEQFSYLKNDGKWAEREDVWYFHKNGKGDIIKGNLRPGQGANDASVGPELAFGHVMGNHFDEQVLLIKCAWGGQAIGMTFRPPSAGLPNDDTFKMLFERAKKKRPEISQDEFRMIFGSKYRQTLAEVDEVVSSLKQHFPAYQNQGYEISGFFWHQGWNDATGKQFAQEYESNMTHFIKDMRKDLSKMQLPFVIATSGMGGPDATGVAGFLSKSIEPAQMASAKKFEQCVAIPTRHFQKHKPGRQKSHWHNSAESYCLVGDASAKAMIKILAGN